MDGLNISHNPDPELARLSEENEHLKRRLRELAEAACAQIEVSLTVDENSYNLELPFTMEGTRQRGLCVRKDSMDRCLNGDLNQAFRKAIRLAIRRKLVIGNFNEGSPEGRWLFEAIKHLKLMVIKLHNEWIKKNAGFQDERLVIHNQLDETLLKLDLVYKSVQRKARAKEEAKRKKALEEDKSPVQVEQSVKMENLECGEQRRNEEDIEDEPDYYDFAELISQYQLRIKKERCGQIDLENDVPIQSAEESNRAEKAREESSDQLENEQSVGRSNSESNEELRRTTGESNDTINVRTENELNDRPDCYDFDKAARANQLRMQEERGGVDQTNLANQAVSTQCVASQHDIPVQRVAEDSDHAEDVREEERKRKRNEQDDWPDEDWFDKNDSDWFGEDLYDWFDKYPSDWLGEDQSDWFDTNPSEF